MMPGARESTFWVRQRTDCPEGRKIIATTTNQENE
jgi:hypothetical protein